MHISIKRGLNIPIQACPSEHVEKLAACKTITLCLENLQGPKGLKALVKEGDRIRLGEPIAEDKEFPGRMIVAPASGLIKELMRGQRRVLQAISIEADPQAQALHLAPITPKSIDREKLINAMLLRGLFTHIRQRPFNTLANPTLIPRSIFVKALESAPYVPQPDTHVSLYPQAFQAGLDFLKCLTPGAVHLVHRTDSCEVITKATGVEHHTVQGPHPSANASVHIHQIDPIEKLEDTIWTLTAWDVLVIGFTLSKGTYFNERIVAIAGEGVLAPKRRLVQTQVGATLADLLQDATCTGSLRFVSGDPLIGIQKSLIESLSLEHSCVSVLKENESREFLHFFRPGFNKYTASGAYLSGHLSGKLFSFTTSQHGEERAFIDAEVYDRVMPMRIPTLNLVKSVLCEDFERAQELGLLEVDAEDFALATFVCPSKIEMVQIMKEGLSKYAMELLQ